MNNGEPTFDRLPPSDIDTEAALLGSLCACTDQGDFAKVRRMVRRESFYLPEHAIIFDALAHLHDAGKAADALTLRDELKRRNVYEQIGGVDTLANILNSVPSPASGQHYAAIVARLARQREAIAAAARLIDAMYQLRRESPDDNIRAAIETLFAVVNRDNGTKLTRLGDAVDKFLADATSDEPEAKKIATGFRDIDAQFSGILTAGWYTVLAGRPSMGKSTLCRDMLSRVAAQGVKCGLIAVEETEPKIAGNYLSSASGVENRIVANGVGKLWSPQQWDALETAQKQLRDLPIVMTDRALKLSEVVAAAEFMVLHHGCRVIAIDHLHLIVNDLYRSDSDERRLNHTSETIKHCIKRLGFAGLVAAQLSRPEKHVNEPPPPRMSDLRGSGGLEEHADVILTIHRKDYYHRRDPSYIADGKALITVDKNRNGPVGSVWLGVQLAFQRFIDIKQEHEHEDFPY